MHTTILRVFGLIAAFALLSPRPLLAENKQEGFRFPPFKVKYIQATDPKASYALKDFDFTEVVGKQPLAMIYFLPEHKGSETELKAAHAAAMTVFKDKIRFFAITKINDLKEAKKVFARLKELGVTLPVLLDDSRGLLAYVTLTNHVPSYAVVTRKGYLRLSNASSLMETVRPKMTLLKLLQGVVKDQDPPFTRAPGASPNPLDLIGKPAPAFDHHPALSVEIPPKSNDPKTPPTPRKSEITPPQATKRFLKPHNVPRLLVFWSIRCPHCRTTIPPLDAYAQKHNQRLQVLSFVQTDSSLVKDMLKTFVKDKQIKLTILDDPKGQVSNDYYILKVPTLLLVDAQGIVRGVSTGGGEKVGEDVERLLKEIEKK